MMMKNLIFLTFIFLGKTCHGSQGSKPTTPYPTISASPTTPFDQIETDSPTAEPTTWAPSLSPSISMSPTLPSLFGTLNSFDCFCTSIDDCHGFEIELNDVPCLAVYDTFSLNRYGVPDLIDSGWSCIIRYSTTFDYSLETYLQTTVSVGDSGKTIEYTGGRPCFLGAMTSSDYEKSGCEHFGVSLHGAYSPSSVSYHWLVDDFSNPGQLVRSDTLVTLPFVSWLVSSSTSSSQFVNATFNVDDEYDCNMFGDAKMLKVYSSQINTFADLEDMVLGNSAVPNRTNQVEINWSVLQRKPTCGEETVQPEVNTLNLGSSRGYCSQSIIRRYEFYEFAGTYDPENHEAIWESDFISTYFGNYLGTTISAIIFDGDVAPTCAPSRTPTKAPVVIKPSKPTRKPSNRPTGRPSEPHTAFPSISKKPSARPTGKPTRKPSRSPTRKPSKYPTRKPSISPTKHPSSKPSRKPSSNPSNRPTPKPSRSPSRKPTRNPSPRPTRKPSSKPSNRPTRNPSRSPTRKPTRHPTTSLSHKPTSTRTLRPTAVPSTASPTMPLTYFGSLSNFDCYCTTGEDCHGFDIELEGISCADAPYIFSSNRYGMPDRLEYNNTCVIRYRASYDNATGVYSETTKVPMGPIVPTGGHSCFVGGMDVNTYDASGCEHFGVGLTGSAAPTATRYYWLIADKVNIGGLMRAGTKVPIPSVAWSIKPNAIVNANPVVKAAIAVEDVEDQPCEMYGDAKWVKVYKTEIETEIELDHLVANNPLVPQSSSETEIEWVLLQRQPTCGENGQPPEANELELEEAHGNGSRSVIRRYEFYEYTGMYNAEDHEALPSSDSAPDDADIGDYLGSQMVALLLDLETSSPTVQPSSNAPTVSPSNSYSTTSPSIGVSTIAPTNSGYYGSLSNFDCYCTTGEDCHGFDIELEGISCADAPYIFSSNRYGMPDKLEYNNTCVIRYRASYDNATGVYSETTKVPMGPIVPTGGHSCFVGGMDVNTYDASGCEHFGVGLTGSAAPTATRYYWLIADKVSIGGLMRAGTKVPIPSVAWSIKPNAIVNANPVVKAAIAVEDVEDQPCEMYGDAKWVKVYKTEIETEIELDHLVANNPLVPQSSSETEIEWVLLQRQPTCGENGQPPEANELELEEAHGNGSRSVIRRYEFYEYTGLFNAEDHEALPSSDSAPDDADIGDYLGSQMVALLLDLETSSPTVQPSSNAPTVSPSNSYSTTSPSIGVSTIAPTNSGYYGSLSNFDCYCTTGEDCHGFDIELEGISCADAPYIFSSNRYGMPDKLEYNNTCVIRYRASYDNATGVYSETTKVPMGPIVPTGGHSCFVGGMDVNTYDASGCEHFGVGLTGSAAPTATRYYWLIADKVSIGGLMRAGTKVPIPSVAWSIKPNAIVNANPVVKAAIAVEDVEDQPCEMYGDAKWVKVYKTEIETEIELDHLVANNPLVPQSSSETEIEWVLLQRQPTCGENGQPPEANELELEEAHGNGSRSVIRRYEFYEYTGLFNAEDHEALPSSDSAPDDADIGDYLGSQMVALLLDLETSSPTVQPSSNAPTVSPSNSYSTTSPSIGVSTIAPTNSGYYGSLSNFDCYCTTGEDCHGFDIELEGISCADAPYIFSSNRYGMPDKLEYNNTCVIRYRASYDNATGVYSETTKVPMGPIVPTGGHSCFVGGMDVNTYDASGCEHFGVGLTGSAAPTATRYYWLIADKVNIGGLMRAGTKVPIPSVAWSIKPNAIVNANPVVKAAIAVEDVEDQPCEMYGDAKWVVVYKTEIETEIELDHLVANNPLVPQSSSETEIEWVLLQRQPTCGENGQPPEANELELEEAHGNGSRSVIRRYEFYEYTGMYNAEDHEALNDRRLDTLTNIYHRSLKPITDVGNYLGSQMVALVLDQVATNAPTVLPFSKPSSMPSSKPTTAKPSSNPSFKPSLKPTQMPTTVRPSSKPTRKPSRKPTSKPTTAKPSSKPSFKPSLKPTQMPTTVRPSPKPTRKPSRKPTSKPTTAKPSSKPSFKPSLKPTRKPTSARPSSKPTRKPSGKPTSKPTTAKPSSKPSLKPTRKPTSARPSSKPTRKPSRKPTAIPSIRKPTRKPSNRKPTRKPTKQKPTRKPTKQPSYIRTKRPSKAPTRKPTKPPSSYIRTKSPSKAPTRKPSVRKPTKKPSKAPTRKPVKPTRRPTRKPTAKPKPV